jgi:transcriptional regulator with XRE-family HTH domain
VQLSIGLSKIKYPYVLLRTTMGETVMDMGNTNMSVSADDVRENRERRGMTQEELAREVGVTVELVKAWESGERLVPKRRMATVRTVLGMDEATELFGRPALLRQLGALAKRRREELGLGRQPFAKEIGLGSDRTISQFEFGRTVPSSASQTRIEKGLGWRLGAIEDTLRMVDRKATDISMQDLDAEDSLHIAAQSGPGLALVSNEDLLAELARRLSKTPTPFKNHDVQNLYGLAASTNSEHLEDDHLDLTGEQ